MTSEFGDSVIHELIQFLNVTLQWLYLVTYKDYSFTGDLCINPTIILIENPYYPDYQIRIPKLVANILSFAKN